MKRGVRLKKIFITFFLLLFFFYKESIPAKAESYTGYQNPKGVLIAAPAEGYRTSSEKVSILGTCDPTESLYRNGNKIKVTSLGFFTEYVDLKLGENVFVYRNGNKFGKITIIREKEKSEGAASSFEPFSKDTFAVMQMDNATRRAAPDLSDQILTPLNQYTTFRVFGRENGYVKLVDGSYVYESAVKLYSDTLPISPVFLENSIYRQYQNICEIQISTYVNVPYQVEITAESLNLTLYDATLSKEYQPTRWTDVPQWIFDRHECVEDKEKNTVTWQFYWKPGRRATGFDVEYLDGLMIFSVKNAPTLQKGSLQGATILLDAGHGKEDPGAVGPMGIYGAVEKDLNLNIMLHASEYLKEKGATVITTREEDSFTTVTQRSQLIKKKKPDISVSIHHNSVDYSADYSSIQGFLTYYSFDYLNNVPEFLTAWIGKEMPLSSLETSQRNLGLTRITNCPALLLEIGFLSNPEEYEFWIKESNQEQMGNAIGKAVERYLYALSEG